MKVFSSSMGFTRPKMLLLVFPPSCVRINSKMWLADKTSSNTSMLGGLGAGNRHSLNYKLIKNIDAGLFLKMTRSNNSCTSITSSR